MGSWGQTKPVQPVMQNVKWHSKKTSAKSLQHSFSGYGKVQHSCECSCMSEANPPPEVHELTVLWIHSLAGQPWTAQWQKLGFGLPQSSLSPIRQAKTSLDKWPEKNFLAIPALSHQQLYWRTRQAQLCKHHTGWKSRICLKKRYWKVFLHTFHVQTPQCNSCFLHNFHKADIHNSPRAVGLSGDKRKPKWFSHYGKRVVVWKAVICQCKTSKVWNYNMRFREIHRF